MKRRLGGGVNEDRISDLLEDLLLHILSLLPVKDVVATSVLSKRWRSLWKLVPKLNFDYENNQSEHEEYSEIVSRVLLTNKAPVLESLHLDFEVGECRSEDVAMWIGIAYGRRVRELFLSAISLKWHFTFPTSLFNCETLESLTLESWVYVYGPSQVRLKSLRTLRLDYVNYADDGTFVSLLSGCHNLENLVMNHRDMSGMKSFTIAVPSLQRLTISDENIAHGFGGGYVINAPSLKYLNIDVFEALEFCLIENAPQLVEAKISNVSKIINEKLLESLTSVKRLSLDLSPLEKRRDENKRLAIGNWNQPKNVPGCLLFHLETFVWIGCKRLGEDEIEVAKYILRNTNRLKKATFSTIKSMQRTIKSKINEENNSQDMIDELVEELENVVRASNSCQLVFECNLKDSLCYYM